MTIILKKSLLLAVLLAFALSLSACRTTREERVMYGTLAGAAIGGAIGATNDEVVAGIAIGASIGAIGGFIVE